MPKRHLKHERLSNFSACGGYSRVKTKWVKDVSCHNCDRTHIYRKLLNPLITKESHKQEKIQKKKEREAKSRVWLKKHVLETHEFTFRHVYWSKKYYKFVFQDVQNASGDIVADHLHINLEVHQFLSLKQSKRLSACVVPYVKLCGYTSYTLKLIEVK
jgi:hypothetical protein